MMIFLPLAVILSLQGAPASPLEQGRALTAAFYKGEMDTVWSRFSPQMREAMGSVENLRGFRGQVESQAGVEQSVVDEKTAAQDGTVQGFFIRPLPEEPTREQLEYSTKTELRLPFTGAWFVFWGGRSVAQNYHFATVDQRFAYDLVVQRGGRTHAGEGKRNEDYHGFDQKILAPAAGTVVAVENAVADNLPGVMNPKMPMGNHVVLDHGNGEFSFLGHFRQGTVAVKKGDKVNAGDLLGRCGNSGNSSEPHLHYHLQDSADFGQGRGLPAPFRAYRADGKPVACRPRPATRLIRMPCRE